MAESRENNRRRLRQLRRDNPEWNAGKNARWRAANKEKNAAHKAVEYAIKRGTIVKQPCERCGTNDLVHAHHDDYSKRLDVIWLCPIHHRERHREIDAQAASDRDSANQAFAIAPPAG